METLHPGLYMQEIQGEQPIQGVSTSTGAFVGITEKGVVGKSGFVTSWNQFLQEYGGFIDNSYLAYSVYGFFDNGGTRAYISRAVKLNAGVKTSAIATVSIQDTEVTPVNALNVDALSDGTWGNAIEVETANYNTTNKTVDFAVYYKGDLVERWTDVVVADLDDVINSESKYVTVAVLNEEVAISEGKVSLAGGEDGITDISGTDYVAALQAFNNDPINILAVPGITDVAVIAGVVSYVENRKDAVAIIDVPYGSTPTEAREFKLTGANIASARANLYYGWGKIADPIGVGKNPTKFVPPSGHIAGIYARTDASRGVFKAPAGLEATVRGFIGLDYNVSDPEQDILNPVGVNCIRAFDGEGIVVWGSRTCSSLAEYRYTPVRRSIDYIQQSLMSGSRWSVFEPNNDLLWGKLKAASEAFLRGFWRAGGLKGKDESAAFFVKCDDSTTTADDIDNGKVFTDVGVAPQKPAEFVIFRLSLRK